MRRLFILDDHTPPIQSLTSTAFFRVLCIDNNITLLKAYKLGLQRYGFEVIIACHGMDALMQFQAHDGDFRAVITNEMHHTSGSSFIRAIRKAGYTGKVLVVASGHLKPEIQDSHKIDSGSDFVHNPFDIDILVMMLLQD